MADVGRDFTDYQQVIQKAALHVIVIHGDLQGGYVLRVQASALVNRRPRDCAATNVRMDTIV